MSLILYSHQVSHDSYSVNAVEEYAFLASVLLDAKRVIESPSFWIMDHLQTKHRNQRLTFLGLSQIKLDLRICLRCVFLSPFFLTTGITQTRQSSEITTAPFSPFWSQDHAVCLTEMGHCYQSPVSK